MRNEVKYNLYLGYMTTQARPRKEWLIWWLGSGNSNVKGTWL